MVPKTTKLLTRFLIPRIINRVPNTTNINGKSMSSNQIENQNLLIPERYPERDLFICDVADAVIKDIMPQMEHPFYSLSKKPEMNVRRYEHNGNWLEVIPSYKGLATIYDKDILIFAISQIIAKLNAGEEITTQHVRINSHELLKFTNRGTSGRDYMALSDSLDRLAGTRIKTNILTGDEIETKNFGLINESTLHRKNGHDGRLLWVELELSSWVFHAIKANEVLTLHRDYFRLRKPIERRIYEVGRKHCGKQAKWSISLGLLHKKSGSQSLLKKFRFTIKDIVKNNHLPDYYLELDEKKDLVTFLNREKWWENNKHEKEFTISPTTYEEAKKYTPGQDVYHLEQLFRSWIKNKPPADNINAAFIGFCKKMAHKSDY